MADLANTNLRWAKKDLDHLGKWFGRFTPWVDNNLKKYLSAKAGMTRYNGPFAIFLPNSQRFWHKSFFAHFDVALSS